jgi:hypothetical protein
VKSAAMRPQPDRPGFDRRLDGFSTQLTKTIKQTGGGLVNQFFPTILMGYRVG